MARSVGQNTPLGLIGPELLEPLGIDGVDMTGPDPPRGDKARRLENT